MINLRKLRSLPEGTRIRKTAVILQSYEESILSGDLPDLVYLRGIFQAVAAETKLNKEINIYAEQSIDQLQKDAPKTVLQHCNTLRHKILTFMGTAPADWDFISANSLSTTKEREVKPLKIFLDDVRSPFNIGAIFRVAESFGIEKIYCSEGSASPLHTRAQRTAMGCISEIPWEKKSLKEVQEENPGDPFFALECGGTNIGEFPFPKKGIAVIGSEELGISPESRRLSEKGQGLVTIPLYGRKGSINVSVATGILLYHWFHSL